MLKQRIFTALILIPLVLAILFYLPPLYFSLLTAILALGCAWEWSKLMSIKHSYTRFAYCVLMAILFFAAAFTPEFYILSTAFCWWLIAAMLVIAYPKGRHWWTQNRLLRGLMGVFVLVPCWAAIHIMRLQNEGTYALLFLFVLIWGADSAAYFTGKLCGKNKLAPSVSPGKSWQGFFGALFFGVLISFIALAFTEAPLSIWPWTITLSLLTVIFSVIGDLFESMLKREAGVKDSGQILPGHGGLLDRIDSLTAAAPIFAFGSFLLGVYIS